MFYSNEVDLIDCKTVSEMVDKMIENNIDSSFQIVEFMSIPSNFILPKVKIENFSFNYTTNVHINRKSFPIEVKTRYYNQPYTNCKFVIKSDVTTIPEIGGTLQRKNIKKGLENIRLNHNHLKTSIAYDDIVKDHKKLVLLKTRESIAKQLLDIRKLNIINEKKRIALSLQLKYENILEKDKEKFLIENGFTGLENLNIYTNKDDGYGHKTGITTEIDFENKNIYTRGYSSDD